MHKQAACAKVISYGYDAINLNCGCPSERVAGGGCFGAALMRDPPLVAELCSAMAGATGGQVPTVKCRIGVLDREEMKRGLLDGDEEADYASLYSFVRTVGQVASSALFPAEFAGASPP